MTLGQPMERGPWPAGDRFRADGSTAPAKAARWDQSDLIRRVLGALDVASEAVRALVEGDAAGTDLASPAPGAASYLPQKIVAETAMLLLCAEPIQHLDERIRERVESLAQRLVPRARSHDVLAAMCFEPGLASDHALAHLLLSRLGYPDSGVDRLLAAASAMGADFGSDFGPERLPHRRLEQGWLARLRRRSELPARRDSRLVADSMLGRPLDALGSTRLDVYAFTHAVLYASDLGARRVALPRSRASIAADAEAALALSLDTDDFDLTAEVLLTWPMLGLRWSPAATFAFRILADVEDAAGFVPGSAFDPARYETSSGDERARYMLATCYHTAYVMGFLCAAALRPGCAPPAAVAPARRSRGAAAAVLNLLEPDGPPDPAGSAPCWRGPLAGLGRRQQDAVAPLLLAVLLRRARTAGDLGLLRRALEVALAHGLISGPAPLQAAALLRRSEALTLALSRR